jgi:HPt (histidine-containing phosphotransfer) domain-containing protein
MAKISKPGNPPPAQPSEPQNLKQTPAHAPQAAGPGESSGEEHGAIDYASLLARCLGSQGLAERLVAKLTEQASADVAEVAAALERGEAAAAAAAAHRVKGAAANVSVEGLRRAAAQLGTGPKR